MKKGILFLLLVLASAIYSNAQTYPVAGGYSQTLTSHTVSEEFEPDYYLTTLPNLRITLDISHWCNLHARATLHPIAGG